MKYFVIKNNPLDKRIWRVKDDLTWDCYCSYEGIAKWYSNTRILWSGTDYSACEEISEEDAFLWIMERQ